MFKKIGILVSLFVLLALVFAANGFAYNTSAATMMTNYYTILGTEGIGTQGQHISTHGPAPSVGDYATTRCRYINVPNTQLGDYKLIYPLHLPNGANVTKVSFHVADFNSSGSLWMNLYSKNWNSRDYGDMKSFTLTPVGNVGDTTVTISNLNWNIDNNNKVYWIDISPQNSADPGQLCVYSIKVEYTIDGVFLPLIQRGG